MALQGSWPVRIYVSWLPPKLKEVVIAFNKEILTDLPKSELGKVSIVAMLGCS